MKNIEKQLIEKIKNSSPKSRDSHKLALKEALLSRYDEQVAPGRRASILNLIDFIKMNKKRFLVLAVALTLCLSLGALASKTGTVKAASEFTRNWVKRVTKTSEPGKAIEIIDAEGKSQGVVDTYITEIDIDGKHSDTIISDVELSDDQIDDMINSGPLVDIDLETYQNYINTHAPDREKDGFKIYTIKDSPNRGDTVELYTNQKGEIIKITQNNEMIFNTQE